jgi:XcyI restriction endonuclease
LAEQTIRTPSPSRQIAFHQLLVAARKTWLMDVLSETLGKVDPNELKTQLMTYVPADVQQILAAAGVRDEHVFPTPIILETQPTLVGYYRLLLGVSQKSFYGTGFPGEMEKFWALALSP